MSERSGIEIDYCPQCRGVWLDRGELDKIIDRATPAADSPRRDDHVRDEGPYRDERPRSDEREYRKRKRRSFLEDLFDFD